MSWAYRLLIIPFAIITAALGSTARADDRLDAVGALSMGHAYTTYAYIGTVHDLYRQERYKAAEVTVTMQRVVRLCDFSVKYLQDVKKGVADADDSATIDELVGIYTLLRTEAVALDAFGKTRDAQQLEKYKQTRADLVPKFKHLLGMEPQK